MPRIDVNLIEARGNTGTAYIISVLPHLQHPSIWNASEDFCSWAEAEESLSFRAKLCHNLDMDRDNVLKILRQHEPELKAAGVVHLRLFGSVARNEATAESDVDLMLDMDRTKNVTLFTLGGLQVSLTEMLGVNADISMTESMREPFRSHALNEAAVVF